MYTKWALLSLCLLVAPASHGAGEGGTAATGERQATEASSDQALAARIKDALGKEPVLRDATNLSVVARKGEVTLSGSLENTAQAERAVQCAGCRRGAAGRGQVGSREQARCACDPPSIDRHRCPDG
jgi:hypothetical protein